MKKSFLDLIKNQLIISCQAVDDEPLNDIKAITLVAKSVIEGGAKVLRLSQVDHIRSIMQITDLPIIGLIKKKYEDSDVFITATLLEVNQLVELGIKCIALDATNRKRPKESLEEIVKVIKTKYKDVLIMADCATLEDVKNAQELGFDLIGTTLRGYTKETKNLSNIENDYQFIKDCLKYSNTPIIAEGGIWEPYQVKDLLKLGCFAVVVGSAITRPKEITKKFLNNI
ncbi:MAG: N-acetylmannosamine-6-phosphate 2-epimerase [Metamycoplasmataceae bacterium]